MVILRGGEFKVPEGNLSEEEIMQEMHVCEIFLFILKFEIWQFLISAFLVKIASEGVCLRRNGLNSVFLKSNQVTVQNKKE